MNSSSVSIINRSLNKLYAELRGYFWKKCDVCGEMFGGHEAGSGSLVRERYEDGTMMKGQTLCWKHSCEYEIIEGKITQVSKPEILISQSEFLFLRKNNVWGRFTYVGKDQWKYRPHGRPNESEHEKF